MEPTTAFVLRMDHRLAEALKSSVIGLGWARAGDASERKDWDSLKQSLRNAYPNYIGKERALGNAAGSAWRFIFEMKHGDMVVVPADKGFYLATVSGEAYYDSSDAAMEGDFAWKRPVLWLTTTPIPRDHASNQLRKRMKARNTCVTATDLVNDIRTAQEQKKPITFYDAVLAGAYDPVAKALHSAVDDAGLEKVICKLAEASGAKAVVLPKNSGKSGDADVMATYDLKIGGHDASINVIYQVKQHQGQSHDWGVQQLLDRIKVSSDIDRACLVTTAKTLNEGAAKLAQDNDILVLTEKELVEWVLMAGLNALLD